MYGNWFLQPFLWLNQFFLQILRLEKKPWRKTGKQVGQGKDKGGLEKGQTGDWEESQKEQGKDKGGLDKGNDKGGLEQSQLKEVHHSRIQQEIAAGFDPSLPESRGRQSRWARQERRRADQAVQDRKTQFETAGPRLEKKPVQQPQEGSQRHKAWQQMGCGHRREERAKKRVRKAGAKVGLEHCHWIPRPMRSLNGRGSLYMRGLEESQKGSRRGLKQGHKKKETEQN